MKSSQILVSALFGAFAAAVPFKRDLVTKTEVVVQTVVVYTTVWDDEVPVAEATTTAGAYSHKLPASSEAETTPAATSTPASTSSAVQTSAAPVSTVVVVSSAAPAPETSSAAPAAPTTTEAAYTPVSVVSSSAPAATSAVAAPATQQQAVDTTSSTGQTYSGDLTINPLTGALGACGEPLYATDMVVALAADTWGTSTYDVMTGASTNPWCGKKINIEYNGKTVAATIMDMCPGCSGADIDLSDAAWAAIGMTEWTRVQGSWSVAE